MNANETRVCVIGNAAIDMVFRVDHLPLAGETSLAIETLHDFGGKGANQAVMAQRAGAQVQLFAALGTDADGDRLSYRYKAADLHDLDGHAQITVSPSGSGVFRWTPLAADQA